MKEPPNLAVPSLTRPRFPPLAPAGLDVVISAPALAEVGPASLHTEGHQAGEDQRVKESSRALVALLLLWLFFFGGPASSFLSPLLGKHIK